jgi:transcriptional regulator with XRE-family HTH domain
MARTKTPANVVGPQIRKLRNKLALTQDELAARCQLHGLDITRAILSHIEARLRCVTDLELFRLSVVLKAPIDDLFPADMRKQRDKMRTMAGSGG